MKDLKGLLLNELAEVYDAEKQLTKAFPRLIEVAHEPELQSALDNHLEQTREHVARLVSVFEDFDAEPRGKRSIAMVGLIAEAVEWTRMKADAPVMDAALILAIQKIEHYEIASYGGLRTWADLLGMDEAVVLLDQTTDEEKDTDALLNEIAGRINVEAAERGDEYEIPLEQFNRARSRLAAPPEKSAGGRRQSAAKQRR
jgi:ferritin-like metal-binding protein YciE